MGPEQMPLLTLSVMMSPTAAFDGIVERETDPPMLLGVMDWSVERRARARDKPPFFASCPACSSSVRWKFSLICGPVLDLPPTDARSPMSVAKLEKVADGVATPLAVIDVVTDAAWSVELLNATTANSAPLAVPLMQPYCVPV